MATKPDFIRKRVFAAAIDLLTAGRDLDPIGMEAVWKSVQNIANELSRMTPTIEGELAVEDIEAIVAAPPYNGNGGITAGDYEPQPEPVKPTGGGAAALAELLN